MFCCFVASKMDANDDIHSSKDEFELALFQDDLDNIMENIYGYDSDRHIRSEDSHERQKN